jgi:hypothetical protein
VVEEEPSSFIHTLGFWLWIAGADIPVVWGGLDDTCLDNTDRTTLPPLEWVTYKGFYTGEGNFIIYTGDYDYDYDYDHDTSDDEMFLTGELEQDLSGHLRKEIHSRQTPRMLRQGQRRKAQKASGYKASGDKDAGISKVNVNRTLF